MEDKITMFFKMCANIIKYPFLKIIGGGFLSILSFLFNGLLREAMIALFVLMMFDFVTGIMAVRRSPTEKIESRKLWVTAGKMAVYFLLISSGNLAEHGTHAVFPYIDETIISFLAVTELLSILENAGRMGYAVPKKLIEKLSKYRDTR